MNRTSKGIDAILATRVVIPGRQRRTREPEPLRVPSMASLAALGSGFRYAAPE